MTGRARRFLRSHYGLAQVLLVVAAIEAYELARKAMTPNWEVAERHARDVLSVERYAHIAWEHGLQRAFLGEPGVVRVMNVFYFAGHFVVTAVFFLWLYHSSTDRFRRFRNGFLVATFLALVVHWRFPTAPPRLAGIGLEDTLQRLSGIDIGSQLSSSLTNPVAAVPSLHAGWAAGVGVGLVLYARPVLWRVIGVLYPVAVLLTIVVTGNHFVVDALAGIVVMALGFWLAAALFDGGAVLQSTSRRGVEQSGSSPGS